MELWIFREGGAHSINKMKAAWLPAGQLLLYACDGWRHHTFSSPKVMACMS